MVSWLALVVLNPTVTLTAGPMPASAWAKELSKATGTIFDVAGSVRDDVIFTGVKDVPLEELKRRVAEVVAGEWRATASGYELFRSAKTEAEQAEVEKAGRLEQIEKALKNARELAAQPFDAEALARDAKSMGRAEFGDFRAVQGIGQRSPISRLLYRLIGGLDAKVLAVREEDDRQVFAERPTRRQLPIGPGARAAIDAYVREQGEWAEVAAREKVRAPDYGIFVGSPYARLKREEAPQGFFLDVRTTEMATSLSVYLYFLTEEMGPSIVAQYHPRLEAAQKMQRLFEEGDQSEDRSLVPFHAVSQALVDWMEGFRPDRAPVPLERSAIEAIIQPERDEPLRWVVGDLLSAMATDGNLVAALPERSLLYALASAARLRPTRGGLLAALTASRLWKVDRSEGWTLVRPVDPVSDRRMRVGRRDLGDFLRAGASRGSFSMRSYAKYMARTSGGRNEDLGFLLAAAIDPAFMSNSRNEPTALRLYGSIPDSQLSASGGKMEWRFSNLNPLTRFWLERAVYSELIDSADTGPGGARRWRGARLEPTIVFPDGLPAVGVLSLEETQDEVLVAYRRKGDKWAPIGTSSAFQIASQVSEPGRNSAAFTGQAWAMTRQNLVRLRATLAEGLWQEWSLDELVIDPNVKPVDWTELPQLKEEVERAIEEHRKRAKDSAKPPL
jgi:hypothetical protein